jgi:exodeoxyribonuclease V alpha subunit
MTEDQITGVVESIVFSSDENGFCVARFKEPKKSDMTTIVGTMPNLKPGESLTLRGIWRHHPQFGRQFDVKFCDFKEPTDVIGIQKYLESGLIKGIGPVFAKRIVKLFGTETLNVIDKCPDRLFEVDGMGEKRVEMIEKCWADQKAIRNLIIFLRSHDVSPALAQKIYKRYGEKSLEILKENPYQLAKDIHGIGFKTADSLAKRTGIPHDSPQRVEAAIEHMLWELTSDGHVCYPESSLIDLCAQTLEVDNPIIQKVLASLQDQGRLIQHTLAVEGGPASFIWLKALYSCEVGISRELKRIATAQDAIRPVEIEKALAWVQEKLHIELAPEQAEAVRESLTSKLHILTGGPGTGKSTITNAIIKILEKVTSQIVLAAPTGRAAKRMSEITGRKASTIHSLLEFDFAAGGFKRNRDNPLSGHLFIIDEASMIDTQLMYHLLKALPSTGRLLLIGDIDQLPSIGPGNVLKDLIQTQKLPMTRLTEIFRQAKGSKIITNAHRINRGISPDLSYENKGDFLFIQCETPEEILDKVGSLIAKDLPEHYELDAINDIQVLSPMRKGGIGIENLNHHLQELLNPNKPEILRMGHRFREGDKVMQMRNNYNKLVFNGDVGRILEILQEDQIITVDFDGKHVEYDFSELDELALAYACSVHKYQGSECPCIIMLIHTSHYKMLNRNLIYTGITRGRKLVVIIGTKKALAIGVKNDEVKGRYTGLKQMIGEIFS